MNKKIQMRSLSGMSGIEPKLKPESTETKKEPLVTVNIKITKSQKMWLATTASNVRDNNESPVAPSDRVYPQHLIGVAIDLLKSSDVNWQEVSNIEDLREQLKL